MTSTASPPVISSPAGERAGLRAWLIAHRWALLVFTVLVIAAAGVRLLTFDRYLPFLDYADENNMYLLGRDWRGAEDVAFIPEWLAGYPPLYVWINIAVQSLADSVWAGRPWILITDYFYWLRLLAAAVGILTTLVVAALGWEMAGAVAGWLTGLVWALSPIIVEHNSLAIPDPFVYLTCAGALWMAARALRLDSPRWLMGSIFASIAAMYLKYPAAGIFAAPALAGLMLLRRSPRRVLPWLAAGLVVSGLAGAYLVFGYGALNLSNREAETVRGSALELMMNADRNFNNWWFAVYPIGAWAFWPVIGGGLIAYVVARRKGWRVVDWRIVMIIGIYSIVAILITTTFTNVWFGAGKIRHVLPITVGLAALWGAGVAQIGWTVDKSISQRSRKAEKQSNTQTDFNSSPRWIVIVMGVLAALVLLPGDVTGDVRVVEQFQRQAMPVILWKWSDVNLPNDGLILANNESEIGHAWNRPWSGYDGAKPFAWWHESTDEIVSSTPERYVERGIRYFVMDEKDRRSYFDTPEAEAFFDQLTLVKTFPAASNVLGETTWFYRMLPPAVMTEAVFGEQIALRGYDLTGEMKAGGTIQFSPFWRATRRPDTNYSMFMHLYPADEERLIAQYDGAPTVLERPTLTWDDPDELLIGATVGLAIPADTTAGQYRLVIGLYDYSTGTRLELADGATYFSVPITIT